MIVHLDADCFYVSVERIKDSKLMGLPVIVGGGVRGVVASASYEARKFGIHAAMPIWKAAQLCPTAVFVPIDMDAYKDCSAKLFSLVERFSPDVEQCSIDEGYISFYHVKDPIAEARNLQRISKLELGLTISLGIGSNKLVSQIAGKLHKPEGFTVVPVGTEKAFLSPLSVAWLPGFGPKATQNAKYKGFATIGDIQTANMSILAEVFGKKATKVNILANGIDPSAIRVTPADTKSYSEQQTFEKDVRDKQEIYRILQCMLDNVMRRVRLDGRVIGTVEVKLRTSTFRTYSKSISVELTDNEEDLYATILRLLNIMWQGHSIRLVGLCLSNPTLKSSSQLDLFAKRNDKITKLLDTLKSKFGENAVKRGHSL